MNRSMNTPPMFIAIPCAPAGSPNRNSWRITVQSGRQFIPRCQWTTSRPEQIRYNAQPLAMKLAIELPIAAPAVPKRGIGPSPRIRITLKTTFSTVSARPRRSGVRASPAARNAPLTMKNSSMPTLHPSMMRRNGSASRRTSGAARTSSSSEGANT